MCEVSVKQLIVCTKTRRGDGKREHSPIRVVTEVFDFDGKLIADEDPCGNISPEVMLDFLKSRYKEIPEEVHRERIHSYFIEDDD